MKQRAHNHLYIFKTFFFFQAEDGIRDVAVTGVQTCALPICGRVHTFCHAIPGRWHVMGVTQAAGLSLRWFRDTFTASSTGAPESYDHLTAEEIGRASCRERV